MSTDVSSKPPGDPAQAQAAAEAVAPPAKMSRESVTVIATLLVATFVVILNETIMNVALQTGKNRTMNRLDTSRPGQASCSYHSASEPNSVPAAWFAAVMVPSRSLAMMASPEYVTIRDRVSARRLKVE